MNAFLQKHKKRLLSFSAVVVIASSGYGYYSYAQPKGEIKYLLGTAERGMFIASLTGTGQVSGENQVDVQPTISGKITHLAVKAGQAVKQGDILMQIDTSDAKKTIRDAGQSVRDAQISLNAAKLSMTKLRAPASAVQILQAENSLNQAKRELAKLQQGPDAYELQQAQAQVTSAEQNAKISSDGVTPQVVRNAYDNSVATLKAAAQAASDALTDADSILGIDNTAGNLSYANLLSILDVSKKNDAKAKYTLAKPVVLNAISLTDILSAINEDPAAIDVAFIALQDAMEKTSQLLGDVQHALNATLTSSSFSQSSLDSLKANIASDRSNISSKQSSLISQQQSILQAKTSYMNSGLSLQQAKLALEKLQQPADTNEVQTAQDRINVAQQQLNDLKAGALAVDIAMQQNSIDQRTSALSVVAGKYQDALKTLEQYTIRAPFDGVVAKIPVHVSDSVSPSTAIATLVGAQQVSEISLNEVDAAKVKVGQKVTLTFDAVDGLTMTGKVDEVGTIGTVSQGVVNYLIKIMFDTQDDRVKSGMSVRAAIVTQMDQDMVLVPNAAVKSSGNQHYVEIMEAQAITAAASTSSPYVTGTPRRQLVEIGSANDTNTEIISGLKGDEQIVIQTIQPTTTPKTTATTQTNALRSLTGAAGGAAGAAGGAVRGGFIAR